MRHELTLYTMVLTFVLVLHRRGSGSAPGGPLGYGTLFETRLYGPLAGTSNRPFHVRPKLRTW
jgi:hypothetical protein